jgi:DNA-binding NarL/FixJ family response regulator
VGFIVLLQATVNSFFEDQFETMSKTLTDIRLKVGANKQLILYALSLGILLFILKWIELKWLILSHSYEIYGGLIALMFTLLGIWLALKLMKPKEQVVVIEKEIFVQAADSFERNEKEIERLGLSKREMEVLEHMASGSSNQEIAEKLYLSLSTVKTHGSNILQKLDVKRRTQAVDKAKKLQLIP